MIFPMHASYIKGIAEDNRHFFYATIKNISKKYNVPVFDALQMNLPDQAFGDATHLNRYGSYLFSSAVTEFLRSIGK